MAGLEDHRSVDADDPGPWTYYDPYGIVVASDRPIEVLSDRPAASPDVCVRRRDEPFDLDDQDWFRHWERGDGTYAFRAARQPSGGCLLDFGATGAFAVDAAGGRIDAWVPPSADRHHADVLLVDQVIPRVLSRRRHPMFHGSAVVWGDGALAFLGPSGRGKSTLAAYLGATGHAVLTDDCLRLERLTDDRGSRLCAHPAYPAIRLWVDALDAIAVPRSPALPLAANDPDKRRVEDPDIVAFAEDPAVLDRVVFLAPPDPDRPDEVWLEPLVGAEIMGELLACQFLLDHTDDLEVRSAFETATLLGATTPCARAHLPRDLTRLGHHAEALLSLLAADDA